MRQTPRLPLSFRNEVVIIFDWLGDIFSGIGSAIGDAMDNDAAGQAANKRISDKLFIQGIKHEILVPEFKDWNEDLLCDEQEETECQTLQL